MTVESPGCVGKRFRHFLRLLLFHVAFMYKMLACTCFSAITCSICSSHTDLVADPGAHSGALKLSDPLLVYPLAPESWMPPSSSFLYLMALVPAHLSMESPWSHCSQVQLSLCAVPSAAPVMFLVYFLSLLTEPQSSEDSMLVLFPCDSHDRQYAHDHYSWMNEKISGVEVGHILKNFDTWPRFWSWHLP